MTATAGTTDAHPLEVVQELSDLRGPWTDLAAAGRNVFSTWEWASVWWRHFGEGRPLLVHARRGKDGAVDFVLPLYLWSARPFRVARFLGHGPADELGPLCHSSKRLEAACALEGVVELAGLDVLFAELLSGGAEWSALLARPTLLRESSPAIELGRGWEEYLASRSANLRQQVRRRERRLSDRFQLRFRLADDPARLEDDLTALFVLHRARWGPRSPFTRWEGFHRDFAAVALERGWLRLWFLELDERPAAAWYGFRFAGVESYYQAGRDPAYDDDAVGFVLLAHTIREAAEDGMREYRMLRGAEPFKRRFADEDTGLESFGIARGTRGRIATSVARAALRSAALRSAVRRLGGRVARSR